MNKFAIVLPDEVVDYPRFHWRTNRDGYLRLFVRLVGVKIGLGGFLPIYQPTISIEKRAGQLYVEIHFSRWASLITLFDKYGVHPRWLDIRKEYGDG